MTERLPLTRFEQYIYHLDCPSHPWIVHTRLKFEGVLELSVLRDAVCIALKRHPLLSSIIVKEGQCLYWQLERDFTPKVELLDSNNFDVYPDYDLPNHHERPGLKLFLKSRETQSAVYIQFRHICGDGQGITSFIEDLLLAYDALCGNREISDGSVNLSELKGRDDSSLSFADRCSLLFEQVPGLLATATLLFRRFHRISDRSVPSRNEAIKAPSCFHLSLDRESNRKLSVAARELGVTTNDLMLRELIFAIAQWKEENGFREGDSWLRVAIPISLRSHKEHNQSIKNRFSIVILQRRQRTSLQYDRLLELISKDMSVIKKRKLAHTLRLMLRWVSFVPDGIGRFARSDLSSSSTVFSNLGKVFQRSSLSKKSGCLCVGPNRLLQFDGLTAVSYPQTASFFVSQYAGRMNFTMSYHPDLLDEKKAGQILNQFVLGLKSLDEASG